MFTRRGDILDRCGNGQGRLSEDQKSRLRRVMAEPSESNWQNAYSVVISPTGIARTLQQAVCAIVAMKPVEGQEAVFPQQIRIVGEDRFKWTGIPSALDIARAIRFAISAENQQDRPDKPTKPAGSLRFAA